MGVYFEDGIAIDYKSVGDFAGMGTLNISGYQNGHRTFYIGGDYKFAGMGIFDCFLSYLHKKRLLKKCFLHLIAK